MQEVNKKKHSLISLSLQFEVSKTVYLKLEYGLSDVLLEHVSVGAHPG